MSYTIAICDDDAVFRKELYQRILEIFQSKEINVNVVSFENLKRLDAAIKLDRVPIDLLILDIYLGQGNGYKYIAELKDMGIDIPTILTSVTRDYVVEGYDLDAIGYLVKPVKKETLERVLLKAYRASKKERIIISTNSDTYSLLVNEILYIEVINKKVYFHMKDNKVIEIRTSLKSVKDKLPMNQFVQCHRSYLVSIPSIASIDKNSITLLNGEEIPLSRRYYSLVQEKLMDWATIK